jgi:Mg2+ and Co2+ transporter CorA
LRNIQEKLNRVQKLIEEQLLAELERLEEEAREYDQELKREKNENQLEALELYNTQRKLVKVQEKLEKTNDTEKIIQENRQKLEMTKNEYNRSAAKRKQALEDKRKKSRCSQAELTCSVYVSE